MPICGNEVNQGAGKPVRKQTMMESQNSSSSSVVAVPGFGYLPKWFYRRLEGIAFDLGIDARVRKKLLEIYWLRSGTCKKY